MANQSCCKDDIFVLPDVARIRGAKIASPNCRKSVKIPLTKKLMRMLPTLDAPELVFGLCSPVGTHNAKVAELISTTLLKFRYNTETFKVTSLMKALVLPDVQLMDRPLEKRYDTYIAYANRIRALTSIPGSLAIMCCAAVRNFRRSKGGEPNSYLPSQAYIFDQFKRKEEIEALRQVYGRLFILVSIYSEKEARARRLAQRIATDHAATRASADHEHLAADLIRRDEEEEGVPSGQRLRDTFPLADVFVNIDNEEEAERTIRRFLDALFGSNKTSPTRDEYGMYIAKSASLRSLDLSRQVGAAIFSPAGEVVSLGSNEVPKPSGGTYWTRDPNDSRDYVIERDENERIKRALLADVVRRLQDGKYISSDKKEDDLVTFVLDEAAKKGSILREAQLMDLLEFGRIIHAEMSAITDAARLGLRTKDATLYCTTFPCHICAKHVVAAGIKRLLYIEPYPKSYAEELHRDSIILQAGEYTGTKTQFAPFIGISPFRFRELFERGKRKGSHGDFSEWIEERPKPVVRYTVANYLQNETAITRIFDQRIEILKDEKRLSVVG